MDRAEQITQLLKDWGDGRGEALDELMPLVYAELHRKASKYLRNERQGHTLQTTDLINEAYLKLVGLNEIEWQSRNHFYAIASTAMRRILVDHARERKRDKRGGVAEDLPIDDALQIASPQRPVDIVALDEALDRLARLDKRQARIVELRYFAGLSNDETAAVLGVSNATVRLDWTMAKNWLRKELDK
ncbi:MAG: sigma-70 family RNA polymerase sigma factor [Acidobacteria bacterium]|nr:sigma-70 family RNA polymerase sigma factor [Acidobacteriota bacterium]MBK8147169.1 sigma-70 family RNA polymerase sigma factor [Acidobacteriota bacterium]MBK8810333.1 sigma-70 family RNA polymerase sigma factor [Acidobacteriota bacterium]